MHHLHPSQGNVASASTRFGSCQRGQVLLHACDACDAVCSATAWLAPRNSKQVGVRQVAADEQGGHVTAQRLPGTLLPVIAAEECMGCLSW